MTAHVELLKRFYTAFQNKDAETMAACYHTDVQFYDPVFRTLQGKDAGDMWRMLIKRGGDSLKISFSGIIADEQKGQAYWEATYTFSKTNRHVHNKIKASFEFSDGKIIRHHDHFDFWKWSRMALGIPGFMLGWTKMLNKKVSSESRRALAKFQKK